MFVFRSSRARVTRAFLFMFAALTLAVTANAQSPESQVQFDIQAQNLDAALSEFARQSGQELLYSPEVATGKTGNAVSGEMSRSAAMAQLLEGTDLEFLVTPEGGMMVGDSAAVQTYRTRLQQRAGDTGAMDTPQAPIVDENGVTQPWAGVEEIIVTGQKRAERLQDVPIAISAFSPEDLEAQKIEGGFDLLKGVPNVTFSKTNFTGYNFQIRGIGTQAVSATTDPGVAVSFNNTTLIVNRLFEQEYLDVERVEVLRGPQGTLFGRNATAGVINVISAKPELGVWDGMIDIEVGNYNTRRLRGDFNIPIGDTFAIRGAYASTVRDGYGINTAADEPNTNVSRDVDDRDLWTGRLTLGWQPLDRLRFNLLWERFEEDDNRVRTSKQLCHRDPGPEEILGFSTDQSLATRRHEFSQGCLPGSLYTDEAFGTVNGASLPFVSALVIAPFIAGPFVGADAALGGNPAGFATGDPFFDGFLNLPGLEEPRCDLEAEFGMMFPTNLCQQDPYGGRMQSRDLRTIHSQIQPQYRAKADIFDLSWDLELTDHLLFSSQSVYADDEFSATQDYNRFTTLPLWNDSSTACAVLTPSAPNCDPALIGTHNNLTPDGVLCDPQLGCSESLVAQDLAESKSTQYNQEFRLVSSFDGPWNFSAGANYTRFRTHVDYFVFANAFTHILNFFPFSTAGNRNCAVAEPPLYEDCSLVYIDPNPLDSIDGEGHNYFRSANPYELTSSALFGELYWNATDAVKVTLGLRMTWDEKVFTPIPSQLLLGDFRDCSGVQDGDGPQDVDDPVCAQLTGNAPGGRGSPASPDLEQNWREPTGRLVVDWQPVLGFTDETMVYASFSHGYKGGGANPPSVAPPSQFIIERQFAAPPTFEPEFVNAYELGTKNTLFGGALVLNGSAFYYDYADYQVSKIVNRSAANENFDAEIWGLELETIFAPSLNWQFNAAIGWLQTEVGEGEKSIDLMDRTDGGNHHFANPDGDFPEGFDDWVVIKPWIASASNCVVPRELMAANLAADFTLQTFAYCAAGDTLGQTTAGTVSFFDENGLLQEGFTHSVGYDPVTDAPNGGAGFFKDLSGNELPNSPEFTVALGAQYNFDLTRDWRATARVDYYWQDESYARIYNYEPYDRLKSWSNTNLSFWINNPVNGITIEAYVKNVFDETPITGSFLNSDDSGLTTNVFTLDPRLIGVSLRKEF